MKRRLAALLDSLFRTGAGARIVAIFVAATQYRVFSQRTLHAMHFDLLRLQARRQWPGIQSPEASQLHLGCGDRRIPGWLNVDVTASQLNVDLSIGALPWLDGAFTAIVSQHVIEHLELHHELLPLLRELHRVLHTDGELWLSCPDMEKLCEAYLKDKGKDILARTLAKTTSDLGMGGAPSQHYINLVFDQMGEHKNLFDFELLEWTLRQAGFADAARLSEQDLLSRFPGFPPRNDDYHTLYVRARKR